MDRAISRSSCEVCGKTFNYALVGALNEKEKETEGVLRNDQWVHVKCEDGILKKAYAPA